MKLTKPLVRALLLLWIAVFPVLLAGIDILPLVREIPIMPLAILAFAGGIALLFWPTSKKKG